MHLPLDGWRVLVTRPEEQADGLCALIERAGGVPVRFPLIVIEPISDASPAIDRLTLGKDWDWLIFVSANAVRHAFRLPALRRAMTGATRVAAIGRGTAEALQEQGIAVDLRPEAQFNSEGLLASPEFTDCASRRVLIIRGHGGRELMAETLRQRGAVVDYAEVYQRVAPRLGKEHLLAAWRRGDIDALVLSSSDALNNLMELLGPGDSSLLYHTPVAVIGERLAVLARELGCQRLAVAAEASDQGLCAALVRLANSIRG